MERWLGYSLQDLLLFSAETYWRLFERQNTELWPLQLAVLAGLALLFGAALARWRPAGVALGLGLACAWGLAAETFLRPLYEPINWAIGQVTPFFWVQAALLALLGMTLRFRREGLEAKIAIVLLLASLAYPAVALIAGRPLAQAEVAGIAPDPTALATLGMLGLARPGWGRLCLSLLPMLWLALSAATLLTMNAATGWVPLVGLGLALLARLLTLLRPAERTESSRRQADAAAPGTAPGGDGPN